jgi:fructose PTS system EIIA component
MEEHSIVISEVITPVLVNLDEKNVASKDDLFMRMIPLFYKAGAIDSQQEFLKAIYERESMGPTYMGDFIAIPHGKSSTVTKTRIAFCRCDDGFFYETQDGGGEVKLIFMLAIPDQMSSSGYIRLLSRLARLLVYPEFVEKLYKAKEYEEVISAIQQSEVLLN